MSKTYVAAKSPSIGAPVAALALAFVVALQAAGVYALSKGPSQPAVVAIVDAAPIDPIARTARERVPSVEMTIVAQAELPAR
jgi:hypothetical protein